MLRPTALGNAHSGHKQLGAINFRQSQVSARFEPYGDSLAAIVDQQVNIFTDGTLFASDCFRDDDDNNVCADCSGDGGDDLDTNLAPKQANKGRSYGGSAMDLV